MALIRIGGGKTLNFDLEAGKGYFNDASHSNVQTALPFTSSNSFGHGGVICVEGYDTLTVSESHEMFIWGVKNNGEVDFIINPTDGSGPVQVTVTDYALVFFTSVQAASWTPTYSLS